MNTGVLESFSDGRYSDIQELSFADRERVRIALAFIGSGEKVLDIGCRDGEVTKLISGQGNEVCGVDVSMSAVKLARKKGLKAIHVEENGPLPFEGESFSVVFAGEVIEHVLDTDRFVSEVKRVLKPGGKLIITTPNVASFGRRAMLLFGRNPFLEYTLRKRDAGHVRYFTRPDLKGLLEFHGLKVVRLTSEAVNFDSGERLQARWLAGLFPSLGRSIIALARKF